MGETISTLVFRPPKPTHIDPNDYFHLHVDVTSPLYFPKRGSSFIGSACHGTAACGSAGISGMMCGDDSDLISLDRGFLDQDGLCVTDNPIAGGGCRPATVSTGANSRADKAASSGIKYKVPAFFVRRRGAKHTILFSHGNAEDLGMMYKRMKDLALVLCVNVMAYDYTGYGLSCVEVAEDEKDMNEFVEVDKNGKKMSHRELNRSLNVPSENMIYRNIEAAYVYLTQTRGIPSRNIILYGRSLGSGPSCYLAAKTALMGESVGGLILHSPFLSVYKVVADVGVDVRGDLFNNEKRAGNIRCPTLIIHGKQDEVVPFWHAPRLLAAIPPEFRAHPFYVDDLGHNHIESRERDRYIQVITEFLTKYVPPVDENGNTSVLERLMHNKNAFQYDTAQPKPQHTNVIPENERASADEARHNDSAFYINQTWMRHAKVICREVFSDNVICNSALDVVDWSSSGGSREGSGSREGNENANRGNGNASRHHHRAVDARDDTDEFAPWKNEGDRRQDHGQSRTRRSHSDAPATGDIVQIHWPQKKAPLMSKHANKSNSMPVGGNGMKVRMSSATSTRRKSTGRSFMGFRK